MTREKLLRAVTDEVRRYPRLVFAMTLAISAAIGSASPAWLSGNGW